MKGKLNLFREALKLVWQSAPGWATANIAISLVRSFLPLLLVWLLKEVIDNISAAASLKAGASIITVLWPVSAVAVIWFLDEASSDFSNYIRKNQSLKLEIYMYGLLHAKSVRLDLINFERPEYFDCLSRAAREAPWRPNNILNNMISLLRGLFSLLLMAGLILTLHWTLALLLLVANIPDVQN